MMIRSALYVALIALYVLPALWLAYVALASKWSKKASEKYDIRTKGSVRLVLLVAAVPVLNICLASALVSHLWEGQEDTPLHPEGK